MKAVWIDTREWSHEEAVFRLRIDVHLWILGAAFLWRVSCQSIQADASHLSGFLTNNQSLVLLSQIFDPMKTYILRDCWMAWGPLIKMAISTMYAWANILNIKCVYYIPQILGLSSILHIWLLCGCTSMSAWHTHLSPFNSLAPERCC